MNAKKHANSFSTQVSRSTKAPKIVEPLTRSFFSNLIKFEMDFYNKKYTVDTLDELIQYYAKAVEYYDTIKDEISSYFIFKIQDALATKKSLTLLVEQNNKMSLKKSMTSNPELSPSATNTENLHISGQKTSLENIDIKNEIITENAAEELSEGEEDEAVKDFAKKRKAFLEKRSKVITN